jgi:hypothetical protein
VHRDAFFCLNNKLFLVSLLILFYRNISPTFFAIYARISILARAHVATLVIVRADAIVLTWLREMAGECFCLYSKGQHRISRPLCLALEQKLKVKNQKFLDI